MEGEGSQLSSGRQSIPYWQGRRHKKEEWVLEPTENETGQLVVVVQVAERWLAATVAVHFSGLLACLVVIVPFLLPSPIHRAAAAKSFRTAAAGAGIVGVGYLLV